MASRTIKTRSWNEAFRDNQYLILQAVLADPLRSVAHEYAIKRALLSRETTSAGAAPGTPSFYADPLMDTLLDLFHSVAETFSGLELFPTFSDLRVYGRGAIVNPHTQRPAGEVTLSVNVGCDATKIWPFYLGTRHGLQAVSLTPGDGVLYFGCESPHWRGEFEGEYQVQAFFHYVNRRGPNAEWKFDKRPMRSVEA